MVQVKAKYDGKVLIPDQPLDVPAGTDVRLTVDVPEVPTARETPAVNDRSPLPPAIDPVTGKRRLGAWPGFLIHMSDDFNDHLGDDFWSGDDADGASEGED